MFREQRKSFPSSFWLSKKSEPLKNTLNIIQIRRNSHHLHTLVQATIPQNFIHFPQGEPIGGLAPQAPRGATLISSIYVSFGVGTKPQSKFKLIILRNAELFCALF